MLQGLYTLWLRDVKRYVRARSRIVGSLGIPVFFMLFFGMGFRRAYIPSLPPGIEYTEFLIPGVLTMIVLFTSTFSGVSVVWDRQFGFLREIMVSPVSRTTIALGRIFGGATTAMIQALILLAISALVGFRPNISTLPLAVAALFLVAVVFTGVGVCFSTFMKDVHGFQLVMNFFVFPIFLLSGAFFPISEFPEHVETIAKLNPLTYGVDAVRWATIGFTEISPAVDFAVLAACSAAFALLAAELFSRAEVE